MSYTRKFNAEKENSIFAKRLRSLAERKNVSQAEIAKYVGCTPQAIGAYMRGETSPKISDAKEIATFFGVTIDYLAGISDVQTPDKGVQAICASTKLTERAATTLTELHSPEAIALVDALLEGSTETLAEIGRKYIKYLFVKNVISLDAKEKIADAARKGKAVKLDIELNGEKFLPVSVEDLDFYTRLELLNSFMKFVEINIGDGNDTK